MIKELREVADIFKKSAKSMGNLVAAGVGRVGCILKGFGTGMSSGADSISAIDVLSATANLKRVTSSLSILLSNKTINKSVSSIISDYYMFLARYMNKLVDEIEVLKADKNLLKDIVIFEESIKDLSKDLYSIGKSLNASFEKAFKEMEKTKEWEVYENTMDEEETNIERAL
ncbi:hypothetical protein H8D85_01415 [bacterium]|nr:hypothetical protein [bacterium]